MYVYLFESFVTDSADVRFECDSAVYDSWDKADMAVNEFKNECIKQGYSSRYDVAWSDSSRQVALLDESDNLNYHASLTRFEVK